VCYEYRLGGREIRLLLAQNNWAIDPVPERERMRLAA
jgi:hypothetical protein